MPVGDLVSVIGIIILTISHLAYDVDVEEPTRKFPVLEEEVENCTATSSFPIKCNVRSFIPFFACSSIFAKIVPVIVDPAVCGFVSLISPS